MPLRVLVVGASGAIGSETVRASLEKGHRTYAFLRTPSKLPADLRSNPLITLIQGDAKDRASISAAVVSPDGQGPVDAVLVTAPYADMRGHRSGYEEINRNVIDAVIAAQKVKQKAGGGEIKLWVMAGQAVMEHPEVPGVYLSEHMPFTTFYPEYPTIIKYLESTDLNWTMHCPALIKQGKPKGPLVESTTTLPRYLPPYALTRYIPRGWGWTFNTGYNWFTQQVTFQSLGEYMIDNLAADERLRGKRVAVLEVPGR